MAETNTDLANALDHMRINGVSMRKMFESATSETTLEKSTAEAYHAAIRGLYEAMRSGNYDLDNIQESILQVLRESGFGDDQVITMDIGDTTI
jgi:hypothetical protein